MSLEEFDTIQEEAMINELRNSIDSNTQNTMVISNDVDRNESFFPSNTTENDMELSNYIFDQKQNDINLNFENNDDNNLQNNSEIITDPNIENNFIGKKDLAEGIYVSDQMQKELENLKKDIEIDNDQNIDL